LHAWIALTIRSGGGYSPDRRGGPFCARALTGKKGGVTVSDTPAPIVDEAVIRKQRELAIKETVEVLSRVAERGPVIFTQTLGGTLLVVGVLDKVTSAAQESIHLHEAPAELFALLGAGVLLILGGLGAKVYSLRYEIDAANRIQAFVHEEVTRRLESAARSDGPPVLR
jgi:hypothetical protein